MCLIVVYCVNLFGQSVYHKETAKNVCVIVYLFEGKFGSVNRSLACDSCLGRMWRGGLGGVWVLERNLDIDCSMGKVLLCEGLGGKCIWICD